MKERLDKELTRHIAMYKDFYKNEFEGKQIADIQIDKIARMTSLKNELRMLYWIKNEIQIEFQEDKIIIID
jgi:hypothetical protein